MTTKRVSVIIIGGGIGGLCTAIALRQVGFATAVYEQAPELARAGAGLTLWPNALYALGQLRLSRAAIAAGSIMQQGELRSHTGRVLSRQDLSRLSETMGAPAIGIHRADLHQILLDALPPDAVHLNARLVSWQQDEHAVTAFFANGQAVRGDLLIGADGLNSAVRRQLWPEIQPRYAGYIAWRGLAPLPGDAGGVSSESWGCGRRFGMIRLNAQEVYWFATRNGPANEAQKPDARKQELLNLFKGWYSPIPEIIAATPAEAILRNDIYDLPALPAWSRGRVALLGDAAHATTPNMGQGACQAIESAVLLASCLARQNSFTAALTAYEQERRPRTQWIIRQSRRIGRAGQWQHPLACTLRNTIARLTPATLAASQLKTAAGYRIVAPGHHHPVESNG